MKIRILAALATAGVLTTYGADPQIGSGETDGFKLVWQDLFDAPELNPMRWDIEVNGDGGGNSELQYYTDRPENVRLGEDGKGNHCLILTARRENYIGKNFTSGRLNTKNRIAFTHGKIEAAIMFPKTANGLWPAFWMMGNDFDAVGWPRSGEIDIVEMGNSNGINNGVQERYFNGACHWGAGWPNASYAKDTTKSYSLQDGEYHLFTLIWDENSVKMYVDLDKTPKQNPYFSMDIPANEPDNTWSPGNYFHKDNFVLFDLAVGGNFTGIWDANRITALNNDNGQEASMYVNYLRIYQKDGVANHTDFLDAGDPLTDEQISAGAADTLTDVKDEIEYNGDTITTTNQGIEVYNLSGTIVAETSTCVLTVSALLPGIYIVKSGKAVKKIVI